MAQKKDASTTLRLRKINVLIEPSVQAEADEWVAHLMQKAYPVAKPYRRVLLLVNPVGGKGKAPTIVKDEIAPVLEAAGCQVDQIQTTHAGHAEELAKTIDLVPYE